MPPARRPDPAAGSSPGLSLPASPAGRLPAGAGTGSVQALFFRRFRKFHGGGLKVWDYFNHTRRAPGWDAWVEFSDRANWDATNPWHAARDRVLADASGIVPDLFFVAGKDWLMLDRHPAAGDPTIPVVNLIQHVRHADETSTRFPFLDRKAIRICVSDEVATAIRATGLPKGPILTIPDALDLEAVDSARRDDTATDLLVVGSKQPMLARELATRFATSDRTVRVLTDLVPREQFLAEIAGARVTLFLPNETEGFYLPALEGLALGTVVVCPDCQGNRSFVVPGETGFRPAYAAEEIAAATGAALAMAEPEAAALRRRARAMAERHGAEQERAAYHAILADLNRWWSEADA